MEKAEEDIFNFKSRRESVVAQTWGKFKVALLGTLFVMGEDISVGHYMFIFNTFLDFLQMLAFPFNDNSNFPWNPYYTSLFIKIANSSEEKLYMSSTNKLHNAVVYAISFSFVLLNLIISAIVGYRFSKNQVQNPLMLKFVRGICGLFATILYLPLLAQFALICACSLGYQQFDGCPDHLPWQFFVISSLVLSLLFGMVSFVVVVSFYDQDPSSEEDDAKSHARLELFMLLAKAAYTMEFGLIGTPDYMLPCTLTLVVLGGMSCLMFILYLPMYSYANAVRQAQFNSCFFWAALCLAFCVAENNPDDGAPFILFVVGALVVWVIAKFTCEWRINSLKMMTIERVRNPYEVELATRFLLLNKFKTLKPELMEGQPDYEETLNYIEEFYFQAERKFSNSCILQLFSAQFYITYRQSIPDSVVKMEKAGKLHPFIDAQFVIYKRKENAKKHSDSDVVTFITFNTYMQAARRAEINAMRGQVQFWGELASEEEPSISRMVDLSKIITSFVGEANQFYTLLMRMNPNHSKLLHMYGFFLSDIKNDDKQAFNLHNRAEGLEEGSKEKGTGGTDILESTLSIKLVLSLDKGSFGRILHASEQAPKLLQVPKTFIINEFIHSFIPPAIATEFLHFLRRSSEPLSLATEPTTTTILIDGSGHIIVFSCSIRPYHRIPLNITKDQDLIQRLTTYNRSLHPVQQAENHHCLHIECELVPVLDAQCAIVVKMDGAILYLSWAASLLTGITPDFNSNRNIHEVIFMYDRYFEEAMASLKSGNSKPINTFIVSSVGKFSRVSITVTDFKLQGDTLVLVKVKQLGDFDKKTQLFMSIFSHFLKAYFRKALLMQFDGLQNLQVSHMFASSIIDPFPVLRKSKETVSQSIFAKLQDKVMTANNKFSPELSRVSLILLLCLAVIVGLQVVGFTLVEILFTHLQEDLNVVSAVASLQYYSMKVAHITVILDFARQGLDIGRTQEDYLNEMNTTLTDFTSVVHYMQSGSKLQSMLEKNIPILSKNVAWELDLTWQNAIQSCVDQIAKGTSLVENGISAFDIRESANAFFVYENGRNSIASALDTLSQEAVADTHAQREIFWVYLNTFTVLQCVVLLLGIALHIPYALRVENVHIDVLGIFFAMPKNVVTFLLTTSKKNLALMQSETYPDNKVKVMNEEGLDYDTFRLRTVRTGGLSNELEERRKRLLRHMSKITRKVCLLLSNSVTKRVAIVFVGLITYILMLEMYLGQWTAFKAIENSPDLVQSIGMLKLYLLKCSLAELRMVYNAPSDQFPTIIPFDSLDIAHLDLFNQTSNVNRYLTMFRVGDPGLQVPYEVMYSHQIDYFFSNFFLSGCVQESPSDCPTFHGSALTQGLYGAIRIYQSDLEASASM